MKCPNCSNRHSIIFKECDGYSQDIRECRACDHIWSFKGEKLVVIKQGKEVLFG